MNASVPFAILFYFTNTITIYACTYDLYSQVHNVLDACISIARGNGRGLGPGIREFFGPCEMANPGKSVKLCKVLYLAITSCHGLKAGALSSGESWLSRKRKYLFLILVQGDTCLECSFYF